MSDVFTLFEESKEQIIIQVHADDALTVARHPYVNADFAYITVTRGDDNTFVVVRKDGSTFSWHSGTRGSTLISENLQRLESEIKRFLRHERVFLDVRTELNPCAADFYRHDGMWFVDFIFADTRDKGRVCFPNASESHISLVQNSFAKYNEAFADAAGYIWSTPNRNVSTVFHVEI